MVEVADALNLPRSTNRVQMDLCWCDLPVRYEPHRDLPGVGAAPQDVAGAVAVEVADALNPPLRQLCREVDLGAHDLSVCHRTTPTLVRAWLSVSTSPPGVRAG